MQPGDVQSTFYNVSNFEKELNNRHSTNLKKRDLPIFRNGIKGIVMLNLISPPFLKRGVWVSKEKTTGDAIRFRNKFEMTVR